MSAPTPFRDFLAAKLAECGLDRKTLAKQMSSNPGKFYRKFDRWMKPSATQAPGERVPDIHAAKKLAEVLGTNLSEILTAIRAQLRLNMYQMDDKGNISMLPFDQRPAPFAAELDCIENLVGYPLEPDLRAATDLTASTLQRLAAWRDAPNVFERLLAERAFDADWYLAFGGLLQLDSPDVQETTFFAWMRPHAIRTPVLVHRHGFGFEGFVAPDIPTLLDQWERDEEPGDYEILAKPDQALRDLSRAGWIVHRLWQGAPNLLLCDGEQQDTLETLTSASRDPFLVGDAPALLYWLCRSAINHGTFPDQLQLLAAKSQSRLVRDVVELEPSVIAT